MRVREVLFQKHPERGKEPEIKTQHRMVGTAPNVELQVHQIWTNEPLPQPHFLNAVPALVDYTYKQNAEHLALPAALHRIL